MMSSVLYLASLVLHDSHAGAGRGGGCSIVSSTLIVAGCIVYGIQRLFIFKPNRHTFNLLSDCEWARSTFPGARGYQEDTILAKDGVSFVGLWMPADALRCPGKSSCDMELAGDQDTPIVIYFHGNSGNSAGYAHMAEKICKEMRANVFLADYRGYGKSDYLYRPDEQGIAMDAVATFEHVVEKYGNNGHTPIILYGHSLGCFPALCLSSLFPESIDSVILSSPFFTLPRLLAGFLPFPLKWMSFIIRDVFPNSVLCEIIGQSESVVPIIIMATYGDYLVSPLSHSVPIFNILVGGDFRAIPSHLPDVQMDKFPIHNVTCYSHFGAKKRICLFDRGSHDWLHNEGGYFGQINDFISRYSDRSSGRNAQIGTSDRSSSRNYALHMKRSIPMLFFVCSLVGSFVIRLALHWSYLLNLDRGNPNTSNMLFT